MKKPSLQPDRKQSTSSVLSLISSLNAPLAAILSSPTAKQSKEEEEEEEWPKDLRVSIIHNGWLTTSGRPKKMIKRNGLLPKLHRTPTAPIPKWAEIESRPPLPSPKSKSKWRF